MATTRTCYAYTPRRYTYLDHIRQLRLALFNWVLARSTGGQFVVRAENIEGEPLETGTLNTLRWLGLTWDEGPDVGGPYAPYIQSERFGVYNEIVKMLVQSGKAYYCDCNRQRLDEIHKTGRDYDNYCRNRHLELGPRTVIRLAMPEDGKTIVADGLRGFITFENAKYSDPVIVKLDSEPTNYLTAVVDDHHMEITHVLREDNLLASLPISMALYGALDWTPPLFVHLPPVWERNEQTHPDYPIGVLREQRYLPDAVFNYLALLGWNPDIPDEILTLSEVMEQFTLDRMVTGSVEFDRKRLNWFNQQYMQRLSLDHLLELIAPHLLETYPNHETLRDPEWAGALVDAVREQLETLDDVLVATQFAFVDPEEYSPEALNELRSEAGKGVLVALRDALPTEGDLSLDTAEDLLRELRKEFRQTGNSNTLHITPPISAALTGSVEGSSLPNIIALLGAETCRRRIDHALQRFTVSNN